MPRRREGPTLNKQTGYYFMDIYVGFGEEKERIRYSLRTRDPAKAQYLYEREYRKLWADYFGEETHGKPKRILFSELVEKFVSHSQHIRKIGEWKTYERRLKIIESRWGDIDIHRVSSDHIAMLDNFLKNEGKSNKTINDYFGILRAMFYYAIRQKLFKGENPILEYKHYPTIEKRREYSDEELGQILQASQTIEKTSLKTSPILKHANAIISLLMLTGMRLGEALNLRWENIKGDKIILQRTETKEKKLKTIPITAAIAHTINGIADGRKKKDGFILDRLPGRMHQRYTASSAATLLSKMRQQSGVPDFTFHGLRHTAANKMVNEGLGRGVGVRDIMDVLGHSKVETTLRYLHANADRMKLALEILEPKDRNKTIDKKNE